MKKSTILAVGLIGLLMAGGLVLASCKHDADSGGGSAGGTTGGTPGGSSVACSKGGKCYYNPNGGNPQLEWCGDTKCRAYNPPSANSPASCNCK